MFKILSVIFVVARVQTREMNWRYESNYSDQITDNIFLRIYTDKFYLPYSYYNAVTLLQSKYYNPSLRTVFYCHGWTESADSESTRTIISSYQNIGGWNVVAVDYSKLVRQTAFPDRETNTTLMNYMAQIFHVTELGIGYYSSTRNATRIGAALGDLLTQMTENGLARKNMRIVGHSLGGQISSFAAKRFFENTKTKLPRLTALDPAGPIFILPGVPRLQIGDAEMVDVIHTDPNMLGYPDDAGNVDYYPNSHFLKFVQPACPSMAEPDIEYCSHHMSWRYYAESLQNPKAFPSIRCSNKFTFLLNMCDQDDISYMGQDPPANASGRYYLETSNSPPFGKEMFGIHMGEKVQTFIQSMEVTSNEILSQ